MCCVVYFVVVRSCFFVVCCVLCFVFVVFFFFFKQKTAYEMRISDWSSDVCSSDLLEFAVRLPKRRTPSPIDTCLDEALITAPAERDPAAVARQIGRASCRERVCQYV